MACAGDRRVLPRRAVRHRHQDHHGERRGRLGPCPGHLGQGVPRFDHRRGRDDPRPEQDAEGDRPEYRAVVRDLEKRIDALPEANKVQSPYQHGGKGLISPDKHSVLVSFEVPGDAVQTEKRVDASLAVTKAMQKAHSGFTVAQFGSASSDKELMAVFEGDLAKAETLSLPVTLLILILAFGALVAAGLPLLLGLTAVVGTMGLVGLFSQLTAVSSSTQSVILLVGLAVGVDYSLFYIRREREERKNGRSKEE